MPARCMTHICRHTFARPTCQANWDTFLQMSTCCAIGGKDHTVRAIRKHIHTNTCTHRYLHRLWGCPRVSASHRHVHTTSTYMQSNAACFAQDAETTKQDSEANEEGKEKKEGRNLKSSVSCASVIFDISWIMLYFDCFRTSLSRSTR
jgi:hypothetical protein